MSIIDKFKQVLATKEAKALKREIKKTGKKVAGQAQEVAGEAFEKGKELAKEGTEKAKQAKEVVSEKVEEMKGGKISYDTFKKIEVRVGTILSVDKIEKSDKLLKLMVDLGEEDPRQIVSGIAPYFPNEQKLSGRQAMFVTNLEPRKIFGLESDGMIFAVSDDKGFSILEPDTEMQNGTLAS